MHTSVFDLFKIGIGPSSSHTVGPMLAARRFAWTLHDLGLLAETSAVHIQLYGSLGATGHGHGTDKAVLLGLAGEAPDTVDPDMAAAVAEDVKATRRLRLVGEHEIAFDPSIDLGFRPAQQLPRHPNGLRCTAVGGALVLLTRDYYSVGGGFVHEGDDWPTDEPADGPDLPFPFATTAELLAHAARAGLPISGLVLANERASRSADDVDARLDRIWATMRTCIDRGCRTEGVLPGGLDVRRRAPGLHRALESDERGGDGLRAMEWLNLYALAVNEENAAGGRVVTAPTNGAAGVVPSVLRYYEQFVDGADADGVRRFLLTAAAVGAIVKHNASISGAEVGCQGEIGTASAMAAAGLAEVLGGTPQQVENAAEIGMEHHLGLTCDPVRGLVQIPCIERNAVAAVQAVNAARIALRGDGAHVVSLDTVIRTMRQTGADMSSHYKETATGGLAVSVVEC